MEISFGKKAPPKQGAPGAPGQPQQPGQPEGAKQDDKKSSLGGLFGSQKKESYEIPPELKDDINGLARRLKLMEEHFTILRRKLDVTEHNVVSKTRTTGTEIKTIHSELSDLRQTVNKIEDKILVMIKEFQLTAKREDLDVLRKYVDMWAPIKFVTRDEVEKIVHEVLDERQ